MRSFKGKVVWITGASSGIGESLVYAFAKREAVLIISSNELSELERVKHNCINNKYIIRIAPFDLSDTNDISKLVNEQIAATGRIDYLINIGGISQRSTVEETPLWLDRKIMEINYFGTIALTKAVLPFMIKQKSGHILATSSIAGRFGFPLRSAYSASKQALHGFFETLHIENRINNINTSVIIPGSITSEKAAEMIIRGIIKNKREILVGSSELMMLFIRRYFPAIFFRMAAKIKST